MSTRFTIAFRKSDEFNVFEGSGWVVLHDGKRLDWPMLGTREEAEKDRLEFISEMTQAREDWASERRFYNR